MMRVLFPNVIVDVRRASSLLYYNVYPNMVDMPLGVKYAMRGPTTGWARTTVRLQPSPMYFSRPVPTDSLCE